MDSNCTLRLGHSSLTALPLHQEPGQKPGQLGKAWPGLVFRDFGQAYQENAAW